MSNEWTELNTIEEVVRANARGWVIEEFSMGDGIHCKYRGRPKQPKKVIVTSECWRAPSGILTWQLCGAELTENWRRFPAGDITGEVEE